MNYQDKTKNELIKELQKLQQEFDSVNTLHLKDKTEHMQVAEALKESREQYRILTENIKDVVWVMDAETMYFIYISPSVVKQRGYTPKEILSEPVTKALTPEGASMVINLTRSRTEALLSGKESPDKFYTDEIEQPCKNGSTVWTEVITSYFINPVNGRVEVRGVTRDITERKQTEEKLQKSELKYRNLIEQAPDIIFVVDTEGNLLYVNQAGQKILGYSEDELLKMKSVDTYPTGEMTIGRQRLIEMRSMRAGETMHFERLMRRKDGTLFPVEINIGALKDGKTHAIIRDITGRKQAEDLLKESAERLNEAQKLAHIGVWDWKRDTDTVTWTDELYNIAGLDPMLPAPTYKEHSSLFTPKSWELLKTGVEKAMETGESYEFELELIRPNGDTRFVNAFGGAKFDSKGQINGLLGTVQDITERKQVERKLHIQGEIMKNISEGINLIRVEDEIIVFTNQKFDEMFGYEHGEMIGKHVFSLNASAGKSSEETKQDIVDTINRTGEWHGEILNIKKNGDHFWCHADVSVVDHPDYGKVFLSVHSDITERKRAEKALQENEELFRIVISNAPISIFATDKNGIFILHEGKALETVGMKPGENVGVSAYDLFTDLKVVEYNGNVIQGKSVLARVLNGENLSGITELNDVIFDNQFTPIFDKNNNISGLIGVATDITENRKAEASLKESEARFRSIFDNSLLGISIASPDGRLLQVNQAYTRMYGYENPEKMIDEVPDVGKLFAHQEERKEVLRMLQKDGKMGPKEVEVIRRDGTKFFVLVTASAVRDSNGHLIYNQAIHMDISERIKSEVELQKSKKSLEKLNQRLHDVRENERASISREIHDQIGQSLTALKLDLNWMHKYIIVNPEAVAKLEGMIELVSNTIKDVQRISSALRPGILDDLGLAAAIEWYSEEFEERSGIRCSLKLDDSIIDDSQKNIVFFRILQEAMTNVIRHANASSVTIKLQRTQKGTTLTVQDNGIGIAREKVESTRSLGLIGMRERIKEFGGEIDISSKKGKGTKLTIFIPDK